MRTDSYPLAAEGIESVKDYSKARAMIDEARTSMGKVNIKLGVKSEELGSLAEDAADAGRSAKVIEGPGRLRPSLPEGSKPIGKYETPDINDPRPIMRQNETADLLASKGYDVEMLPNKKGGNGYGIKETSNPDVLIEKEVFDCYSPDTSNARNIRSTILSTTEKQAGNVILNLDDCPVNIDDILKAIETEPIPTLDKLMYIKDGEITQVLPN